MAPELLHGSAIYVDTSQSTDMFAQSICTADMPNPNTYLAIYVAKFTPRSQLIDFT